MSTIFGGVQPAPSGAVQVRRQISADSGSVSLPAIPMTVSEDNVHMLTAVRFPPPALFFADPNKNWTMNDFEKPDQPTTYAVTDDDGDAGQITVPPDGVQQQQQREPAEVTTIFGPEAEVTTISGRVDNDDDDEDEDDGDGLHEATTTTTKGGPPFADGRGDVSHRLQPATVVQRWPDRGWHVVTPAPTATAAAASVVRDRGHRRPAQTILLTSRPLPPPPSANVRLPNVDYVISRHPETPTVSLRYVR